MKIYEISTAYRDAFNQLEVDEVTGEILNAEAFNQVQGEIKDKLLNTFCYIKEVNSDIDQLKLFINSLTARKKALERKTEWLKEQCKKGLDVIGETKLKNNFVSGSLRTTESVVVDDMELLPTEFKRVTVEPNKVEIKKAFKENNFIPGAHLESSVSLSIR